MSCLCVFLLGCLPWPVVIMIFTIRHVLIMFPERKKVSSIFTRWYKHILNGSMISGLIKYYHTTMGMLKIRSRADDSIFSYRHEFCKNPWIWRLQILWKRRKWCRICELMVIWTNSDTSKWDMEPRPTLNEQNQYIFIISHVPDIIFFFFWDFVAAKIKDFLPIERWPEESIIQ